MRVLGLPDQVGGYKDEGFIARIDVQVPGKDSIYSAERERL